MLLAKYVGLIELLKKKNDRSNLSGSVKEQIEHGSSLQSVRTCPQLAKAALPIRLDALIRRDQLDAVRRIQRTAVE
jgi:hypothetical protein